MLSYSRSRLLVASGAAGAAVLFRIASIVIEPTGSEGSTRELVAAAAAHPTASYLSTWTEMIAWSLAALACATITGLARPGRGHRLSVIGGWLNTVAHLGLGFGLTFAFAQAVLFVALGGEHSLLLNLIGLVPLAGVWGTWAWLLRHEAGRSSIPSVVPLAEPAAI